MSFGGFSSHLAAGHGVGGGGGGALGALAMGLAPGAGLARGHGQFGHILEGAVGVVERRKRSAGELSASLGVDTNSFAFSGRHNTFCLFVYFLFLTTPLTKKILLFSSLFVFLFLHSFHPSPLQDSLYV